VTSRGAFPQPRAIVVALGVLATSGLTSFAGNILIMRRFADRPRPDDLILLLVPASRFAQYVTEAAIIGSLVLLAAYVFTRARETFAEVVAIFGVMYLIRSAVMVLTPVASAYAGQGPFGAIPLDQVGMFPSGHAAAAFFAFVLIDGERAPRMRQGALVLMLVQWAALFASHAHYSIDVIGGILLGYFVWREWFQGSVFRPVQRLMGAEVPLMRRQP